LLKLLRRASELIILAYFSTLHQVRAYQWLARHLGAEQREIWSLSISYPLEPFMNDPDVEEIDVNSHANTWVSYADGRKEWVGQLWDSANVDHECDRPVDPIAGHPGGVV
jgi:Flp pilus assembly CpaF family ATPase